MSMKTVEFDAFGVTYRTCQFSASDGLSMMGRFLSLHPLESLRKTEIKIESEWLPLDPYIINSYVKDSAGVLPNYWVLKALNNLVSDANFGFLDDWNKIQVPSRFLSNSRVVDVKGIEPIITTLVQNEVASLRELEEYYSLEDAFRLFDILMAKTVNKLLGQEEAAREAKNNR